MKRQAIIVMFIQSIIVSVLGACSSSSITDGWSMNDTFILNDPELVIVVNNNLSKSRIYFSHDINQSNDYIEFETPREYAYLTIKLSGGDSINIVDPNDVIGEMGQEKFEIKRTVPAKVIRQSADGTSMTRKQLLWNDGTKAQYTIEYRNDENDNEISCRDSKGKLIYDSSDSINGRRDRRDRRYRIGRLFNRLIPHKD